MVGRLHAVWQQGEVMGECEGGSAELSREIYQQLCDSAAKQSGGVGTVSFTNLQGQCTCSRLQNKESMPKTATAGFC